LAAIALDKKFGYINTAGKWVIEPQYDWALSFADGKAEVGMQQGTMVNLNPTASKIRELESEKKGN
jgi:hypothetical protein